MKDIKSYILESSSDAELGLKNMRDFDLSKDTIKILGSDCYNYMGPRWSDLGNANTLRRTIEALAKKGDVKVDVKVTKDDEKSSGTPGNVANWHKVVNMTVEIDGEDPLELEILSSQIGSTVIKMDGDKAFISPMDGYGTPKMSQSFVDFVQILTGEFKDR